MPADGPMQVRAGDAAGGAAEPQPLGARDMLALADGNTAEVHVEREEPKSVIDDNGVARVVERLGEHHDAAIAGAHRRTRRSAKIQTFVITGQSAVEDAACAEAARIAERRPEGGSCPATVVSGRWRRRLFG